MKYSVGFIRVNNKNYFIFKERGLFLHKWNGLGGRVDEGEDPIDSFIREVQEEMGLRLDKSVDKINREGILRVQLGDRPHDTIFLFSADVHRHENWEPISTEEGPIVELTYEEISSWEYKNQVAPLTAEIFYNCFRNEVWSYKMLYDVDKDRIQAYTADRDQPA